MELHTIYVQQHTHYTNYKFNYKKIISLTCKIHHGNAYSVRIVFNLQDEKGDIKMVMLKILNWNMINKFFTCNDKIQKYSNN